MSTMGPYRDNAQRMPETPREVWLAYLEAIERNATALASLHAAKAAGWDDVTVLRFMVGQLARGHAELSRELQRLLEREPARSFRMHIF